MFQQKKNNNNNNKKGQNILYCQKICLVLKFITCDVWIVKKLKISMWFCKISLVTAKELPIAHDRCILITHGLVSVLMIYIAVSYWCAPALAWPMVERLWKFNFWTWAVSGPSPIYSIWKFLVPSKCILEKNLKL